MTVEEFLNNPGSTTTKFNEIAKDCVYTLEVIKQEFSNNTFSRMVSISLDNTPVMLGLALAKHDNIAFVNILKNANTTPIGVKLFAPGSGISRVDMKVTLVEVKEIKHGEVLEYLLSQGYGLTQELYLRTSRFTLKDESMLLIEYVLPGLVTILNKCS